MKTHEQSEHRLNLRLPVEHLDAIEHLRQKGMGKLSTNAWIVDAIREKLHRDQVRETAPRNYGDSGRTFYEFFAGGGMARLGLGPDWSCLFANDFDAMKARAYRENWDGGEELLVEDVNFVKHSELPGTPDLIWASFPCQDVSLAGKNAGIGSDRDKRQTRSGTFWPFWRLIHGLITDGRQPKVIVLENVYGILTSRNGKDFAAIGDAFAKSNYRFGALVVDAKMFVPQSRPRVFIVGVHADAFVQADLVSAAPQRSWHVNALQEAYAQLKPSTQEHWVWWTLPEPANQKKAFSDLVEEDPKDVAWHTSTETKRLLSMMSPLNMKKVELAKKSGRRFVGSVYKRTRLDESGNKVQRAEVRFDDIAGCLRTPSGGSSRQLIIVIEGNKVRSRLISSREAARLMGLPDSYSLPKNYNDAYHLCGDGVVVPVVRYLATNLLSILIDTNRPQTVLPLRVA